MVTITQFKNKLKDQRATESEVIDNSVAMRAKIVSLINGSVGLTDDMKRIDYNNIEKELHDVVSYVNIMNVGGNEVMPILKEVLTEKKALLPKQVEIKER